MNETENIGSSGSKDRLSSLLNSLINLYYGTKEDTNLFLPTYAIRVLKNLKKAFPYTTSLIVADFA
jgi:hypothetical protein